MVDGRLAELLDRLRLPGRDRPANSHRRRHSDHQVTRRLDARPAGATRVIGSPRWTPRAAAAAGPRRRSVQAELDPQADVVAVELARLVLDDQLRSREPSGGTSKTQVPRDGETRLGRAAAGPTSTRRAGRSGHGPGLELDLSEDDRIDSVCRHLPDHDEDSGRRQAVPCTIEGGWSRPSVTVRPRSRIVPVSPTPIDPLPRRDGRGPVRSRPSGRHQGQGADQVPATRRVAWTPASSPRSLVGTGQVHDGHGVADHPGRRGQAAVRPFVAHDDLDQSGSAVRQAPGSSGNSQRPGPPSPPGSKPRVDRGSLVGGPRPGDQLARHSAPRACRR